MKIFPHIMVTRSKYSRTDLLKYEQYGVSLKTHQRDDQKALSDYVLIPSSHHRARTFNRNDKRSVGYTGSNIKHTLLILVGRAVTSRTKFRRKTRNNHWHAKYANNNRNFKRSLCGKKMLTQGKLETLLT